MHRYSNHKFEYRWLYNNIISCRHNIQLQMSTKAPEGSQDITHKRHKSKVLLKQIIHSGKQEDRRDTTRE